MKPTVFVAMLLFGVLGGSIAKATVTALYNPSSGNIKLTELDSFPYVSTGWVTSLESQQGKLVQPNATVPLGMQVDYGDLPNKIFWFTQSVHAPGVFDMGNVVMPGTPAVDLKLQWFNFIVEGPIDINWRGGAVMEVPEASTLYLIAPAFLLLTTAICRGPSTATIFPSRRLRRPQG